MTTIDDLRQRLESGYLEPAVEETPSAPLVEDITADAESFTIQRTILSPDEESYFGPGRLLELGYELVRLTSYNGSTGACACRRGVRGTTAATHAADTDEVRIPTRWTRKEVAASIVSALDALWQPLYVIREETVPIDVAGYIALPTDTVRILQVQVEIDGVWADADGTLLQTHPMDDTRAAVQVESTFRDLTSMAVVRYGRKITAPSDFYTDIELLPSKWERIVLTDAAAELLSGVDIDSVTQEVLTEQIRLERFPVRSGSTISQSLIRYREYLVQQAATELTAAYPRTIHMKPVIYSI